MQLKWSPRKLSYQEENDWKKLLSDSGIASVALSEVEHYPLDLEVEKWEVEVVFWSSKYIFGNIKVPTIGGKKIIIDKWDQKIKEERDHFFIYFVYDKAFGKFLYADEGANKTTQKQNRAFSRNFKITEKKVLDWEKYLRDAKKKKPYND